MLKTIVYQSYRTENVPSWISKCMETVRNWASLKGFDYYFIDDRMFSYAPDWYRKKVKNNVLLVSDLARLEIAKELLAQGYDRTIWVDADIVIFDPENFNINIEEEFAFTRELWAIHNKLNCYEYSTRVCNAVTVMVKNNSILDFYIYACKSMVENPDWKIRFKNDTGWKIKLKRSLDRYRYTYKEGFIPPSFVGTIFLTRLYEQTAFPLLNNVGLFSPDIVHEMTKAHSNMLKQYMKKWIDPIYAANLCGSFYGTQKSDFVMSIVEKLLLSKGQIINKYLE